MYTEKDFQSLNSFLDTTFAYSPEHLAALSGKIPMSKKIFCECLQICIKTNNAKEFFNICEQFPAFANEYSQENI